jgi:hypothetical protein
LGDEFEPDMHGSIVVLQGDDAVENLPAVGLHGYHRGLTGVPKDYVGFHQAAAAWEIVVCFSNSYAVTFLVGAEVPLPAELAEELRSTAVPSRIVSLLATGWEDLAVSKLWHGTAEAFVHVAYLAPNPDGVPESLVVAKDGDSSVVRDVYEPLFTFVAGLADIAVGCRLTYAASAQWTGPCEFLLLDVEAADDREPTNVVALRVVCDPGDLTFGSEAELAAFVEKSADEAVRRLQKTGGQDA